MTDTTDTPKRKKAAAARPPASKASADRQLVELAAGLDAEVGDRGWSSSLAEVCDASAGYAHRHQLPHDHVGALVRRELVAKVPGRVMATQLGQRLHAHVGGLR